MPQTPPSIGFPFTNTPAAHPAWQEVPCLIRQELQRLPQPPTTVQSTGACPSSEGTAQHPLLSLQKSSVQRTALRTSSLQAEQNSVQVVYMVGYASTHLQQPLLTLFIAGLRLAPAEMPQHFLTRPSETEARAEVIGFSIGEKKSELLQRTERFTQ